MPKNKAQSINARLYFVGIILILIAIFLWWAKVFNNPENVFWGMLDNSLATSSVTRHVSEDNGGSSTERFMRLQTGSTNAVQTLEVTKQGTTTVAKETIGTPSVDYVRYARIQTDQKTSDGKPIDYKSVEGVWGKGKEAAVDSSQATQSQYFIQTALGTVPFGSFTPTQRQTLIKFMRDKNIYQVSYDDVKKSKENGHSVYTFNVKIDAAAYFEMLQLYIKELGLPEIAGLDPAGYASAEPLSVQFTIVKNSRQLTKITYTNSSQEEFYIDYGIIKPIELPSQTIPINELQSRIQNLQ